MVRRLALYHRSTQRTIPARQVAAGAARGITVSGMVHGPIGGSEAADAGAGSGMAQLARSRSRDVVRRLGHQGIGHGSLE